MRQQIPSAKLAGQSTRSAWSATCVLSANCCDQKNPTLVSHVFLLVYECSIFAHSRPVALINLEEIRAAIIGNRIKWRYHVLLRLQERGITRHQAKQVMEKGEILEQYSNARPFPKCLMMAMVE